MDELTHWFSHCPQSSGMAWRSARPCTNLHFAGKHNENQRRDGRRQQNHRTLRTFAECIRAIESRMAMVSAIAASPRVNLANNRTDRHRGLTRRASRRMSSERVTVIILGTARFAFGLNRRGQRHPSIAGRTDHAHGIGGHGMCIDRVAGAAANVVHIGVRAC